MTANLARRILCLCLVAVVPLASGRDSRAADQARVDQAIASGARYLQGQLPQYSSGAEYSLIGLALLKARTPPDSPELTAIVSAIRAKLDGDKYVPAHHHIYEAGSDAMFLADLGGEKYQAELKAISRYIISERYPTGAWDYPANSGHARGTQGDTSVTQYACLGLWAAERAGVAIDPNIWNDVLSWALTAQNADGGFAYIPGNNGGVFQGASDPNMSFAGMSIMLIAVRHLYPNSEEALYRGQGLRDVAAGQTQPAENLVGGVLERVDLTKAPSNDVMPDPKVNRVSLERIRPAVQRCRSWLESRFIPFNNTQTLFPFYYLYTVERVAALANVTKFGSSDWYDACSGATLAMQARDGSFVSGQYASSAVNTSFVLLFLSKSTAKTIGRVPESPVGGGLLTGGKGAPTEVVAARKEPTPLDELLKSLQNPGSLNLEEAQTELIEQVQLGDRAELVGKKDQLVKLIQHPHGEVRRTAAWALGRTNDLSLARYLVDALEDKDLGVMIEAHAGLCWLSRRFDGFGLPANPLDELPESASDAEKQTAIRGWRAKARRDWGSWYLRVRPYAERGDEFEARLRERIGTP